ncbi:hypothetical protein BH11PLA2_BH11PLA2_06290 [soil metagenome]
MLRELLPFPVAPSQRAIRPKSDLGYHTLTLLRKLQDRLTNAIAFRDCVVKQDCRQVEPRLFFFDEPDSVTPVPLADRAAAGRVARQRSNLAMAWAELTDHIDDAFTVLAASADLRHLARAMPGLQAQLKLLGSNHAKCLALGELLEVADDEVVTVHFPRHRSTYCVRVSGIADVSQFHILLADVIPFVRRPDPRLVDAYRFEAVDHERDTATAVFQFYRPEALQADGALPESFSSSEHWVWGHEKLNSLPIVDRCRVLYADNAVYARQWVVGRKFASVAGELEVLEVISESSRHRQAA